MCRSEVVFQTSIKKANCTMRAISGKCFVKVNLIFTFFIQNCLLKDLRMEGLALGVKQPLHLSWMMTRFIANVMFVLMKIFLDMNEISSLIDFITTISCQIFGKQRLCMRRSEHTKWSAITESWTVIIAGSLIRPVYFWWRAKILWLVSISRCWDVSRALLLKVCWWKIVI